MRAVPGNHLVKGLSHPRGIFGVPNNSLACSVNAIVRSGLVETTWRSDMSSSESWTIQTAMLRRDNEQSHKTQPRRLPCLEMWSTGSPIFAPQSRRRPVWIWTTYIPMNYVSQLPNVKNANCWNICALLKEGCLGLGGGWYMACYARLWGVLLHPAAQ